MRLKFHLGFLATIPAVFFLIAFSAGWDWIKEPQREPAGASNAFSRVSTGEPQLVSIESLESEGQMCEWEPASANRSARFQPPVLTSSTSGLTLENTSDEGVSNADRRNTGLFRA